MVGKGLSEGLLGDNWIMEILPTDVAGEGDLLITTADLILGHIWSTGTRPQGWKEIVTLIT